MSDTTPTDKQPHKRGGAPPVAYRWKPGQSGNPKGRPKNPLCITARVRELGEENNAQRITELAQKVWDMALGKSGKKGSPPDLHAMREIWDRLEGKPTQKIEGLVPSSSYAVVVLGDEGKPNDRSNTAVGG